MDKFIVLCYNICQIHEFLINEAEEGCKYLTNGKEEADVYVQGKEVRSCLLLI